VESSETRLDLGVLGSRPAGEFIASTSGADWGAEQEWQEISLEHSPVLADFEQPSGPSDAGNHRSPPHVKVDRSPAEPAHPEDPLALAAQLADRLAQALTELRATEVSIRGGIPGEEGSLAVDDALARAREIVSASPSSDEITELDALLRLWLERPTDLLVMIKLSEKAPTLGALVRAWADLRNTLEAP
jgi:hypothetical protein